MHFLIKAVDSLLIERLTEQLATNTQQISSIGFSEFRMALQRHDVISNCHSSDGAKIALCNDPGLLGETLYLILMT